MFKQILLLPMLLLLGFTLSSQTPESTPQDSPPQESKTQNANKTLAWGISTGDASAQIGSMPSKTENNDTKVALIYENQTVLEKPATISYFFHNNALVAKIITFTNSSVDDLFEIKEAMSTLYGETSEDFESEHGAWQKGDTVISLGVKEDTKMVFINYASLEALQEASGDGSRRENRRERRGDRRGDRRDRRARF